MLHKWEIKLRKLDFETDSQKHNKLYHLENRSWIKIYASFLKFLLDNLTSLYKLELYNNSSHSESTVVKLNLQRRLITSNQRWKWKYLCYSGVFQCYLWNLIKPSKSFSKPRVNSWRAGLIWIVLSENRVI